MQSPELHMLKSRMIGRSNRLAVMSSWMILAAAAATCPVATAVAAEDSTASSSPQLTAAQVPAEKQTVLGLYVTAKEAYRRWEAEPDQVKIVDVRTPEEVLWVGHPPMAWKIPVVAVTYEWDADKKQFPMRPLPDFVTRVQTVTTLDDTLMVMCRSGGRGAMAVNLLAKAGYKNVYNVVDGMEGDSVDDPDSVFQGQRLVNGWKNSGLPWTYKIDPARLVLPPAR
jgi:rhodanese-related sulfurtransferase